MCDLCKERQRKGEKNVVCTHKASELPEWQSGNKIKRLQQMSKGGQESRFLRETLGVLTSDETNAFDYNSVDRLFENKIDWINKYRSKISEIYVSIDPNNAGSSKFALASCIHLKEHSIVIGLESFDAKTPQDYQEKFINHLAKIKKKFGYGLNNGGPRICLIIENNYSYTAYDVYKIASEVVSPLIALRDEKDFKKPGRLTTQKTKEAMYVKTREFIALNRVKISSENDFICAVSSDTAALLNDLKNQLKCYQIKYKNNNDKTKMKLTGKIFGKNDDLCIALQLNILWYSIFKTDQRYYNY